MPDRRRSVRLPPQASSQSSRAPVAIAQETTSQPVRIRGGRGWPADPGRHGHDRARAVRHDRIDDSTNASGRFQRDRPARRRTLPRDGAGRGHAGGAVEDLHTQLAERTSVTLVALPIAQLAGIEVMGSSERDVSIGADSRYGAQEIKELPSISRDIKDVVRIDPKAWVDPTNSDALEVAGVNNRYNTITVDGVRQNDDFGLNNNGYPTQRSPLSVDAIEAVSVLSAPFSVEYSFFRGSTINMVTKSGTNEFTGSAFYYTGRRQPARRPRPRTRKSTWCSTRRSTAARSAARSSRTGCSSSSPTKSSSARLRRTSAPTGSGFPVEVPGVTQAEYDQIRQIGLDVYGFDVGETLRVGAGGGREVPREARLEHQRLAPCVACLPAHRGQRADRQHDEQQPGAIPSRRAVELVRPRDPDGNRVPAAVLGLERISSRRSSSSPARKWTRRRCRSSAPTSAK